MIAKLTSRQIYKECQYISRRQENLIVLYLSYKVVQNSLRSVAYIQMSHQIIPLRGFITSPDPHGDAFYRPDIAVVHVQ